MLTAAKKEFIEFMMSADVLRFGDFTTKSGRKTPYFVNTGNYRTGAQIATLGKFYAQCIMDNCGDNFDAMFGPAYKTTARAAASSAISRPTATVSSSSRMSSPRVPRSARPCRFCSAVQMSR